MPVLGHIFGTIITFLFRFTRLLDRKVRKVGFQPTQTLHAEILILRNLTLTPIDSMYQL